MLQPKNIFKIEFMRFILTGMANTAFGFSAFAVYLFIGLSYPVALVLSTMSGVLFNFKTTGAIVFKIKNNKLIYKFFVVYAGVYLINLAWLAMLSSYNVNHYVAQAIALPMVVPLSYLLSKRYVFVDNRTQNR